MVTTWEEASTEMPVTYPLSPAAGVSGVGSGVGDGVFLLAELGISPHFYRMLPYIITLVVLAFTSKKSRAPKAEGIPYDKGKR